MTLAWRQSRVSLFGAVSLVGLMGLVGLVLGAAMGVLWWWLSPEELWTRAEGGISAAQLSSSSWFASDAWFLVLGTAAGACLTAGTWSWSKRRPVAAVLGLLIGSALISLVAWTVGGLLGPPDIESVSESLAVGTTVQGPLGLRAMGVLAAPLLGSLSLVALLLALAPVSAATLPGPATASGPQPPAELRGS